MVYDPTEQRALHREPRPRRVPRRPAHPRVGKRAGLAEALIGTGFPFRSSRTSTSTCASFKAVTENAAGVRRAGAAALDLAYVAAGRLDGFWEIGPRRRGTWPPASLLILEAGGLISDYEGEAGYLDSGQVVCGSPKVFVPLLQLVQAAHRTR